MSTFKSKQQKLEERRADALSSITGDRMRVELMAQRPRKEDDRLDEHAALLKTVLDRLTDIESKGKTATTIKELEDLEDDGEVQGLFTAYFCPINEIYNECVLAIDTIEGWGIPKSAPKRLRDLLPGKPQDFSIDPYNARGVLYSIYAEMDAWGDYIDDYEEMMDKYTVRLLLIGVAMIVLSFAALYFAPMFSFFVFLAILFAGATGSCISVMAKVPALEASLKGELDAYSRRVFARIGVGITASLIGCGLLGWGVLPISIENHSFADAIKVCCSPSHSWESTLVALVVLTVPMLLGFSERALTSLELRFLGEIHSPTKRR